MAEELPGAVDLGPETGGAEIDKKKKRKRLKKLCAEIRQQMEFYFSDSNLHKDRFLGGLIKESPDGYVDLEIFSRFNKLRCLTTDMNLVAKALSSSELIQVSEDGKRIKRSRPLSDMSDVDDRTVYVEYLPPGATHDWIRQEFSACGRVLYVSLPKFRSTGDHKGFAFVEFSTKQEAQEACELLNNPPASASENVGKFPKSNKQLDQLQKQLPPDVSAEELVKENIEETEVKKTNKRKHEDSKDEQEESKRVKKEEVGNNKKHVEEQKAESQKNKRKRKASESSVDDASDSDTSSDVLGSNDQNSESKKRKTEQKDNAENSANTDSKKVRISDTVEVKTSEPVKKKRKRRKDKTKEKNRPKDIPELRVIPKQEWLDLRKEYLDLQKKSMRALKKNLNVLKHPKKKENEKAKKTLEFVANVIVKIESDQPTDRKSLKESLGSAGNIAYIDVDSSEHLAHIRCHDPESAKSVATAGVEGFTLKLLQGDEEKSYWDKLRNDQERKLTQPRGKKRGAQKVTEKAHKATREVTQSRTKHVFFDE